MPTTMAAVAIGKNDMGLVAIDLTSGAIRDLSVSGWGAVGQPAWSPGCFVSTVSLVRGMQRLTLLFQADSDAAVKKPDLSGCCYFPIDF